MESSATTSMTPPPLSFSPPPSAAASNRSDTDPVESSSPKKEVAEKPTDPDNEEDSCVHSPYSSNSVETSIDDVDTTTTNIGTHCQFPIITLPLPPLSTRESRSSTDNDESSQSTDCNTPPQLSPSPPLPLPLLTTPRSPRVEVPFVISPWCPNVTIDRWHDEWCAHVETEPVWMNYLQRIGWPWMEAESSPALTAEERTHQRSSLFPPNSARTPADERMVQLEYRMVRILSHMTGSAHQVLIDRERLEVRHKNQWDRIRYYCDLLEAAAVLVVSQAVSRNVHYSLIYSGSDSETAADHSLSGVGTVLNPGTPSSDYTHAEPVYNHQQHHQESPQQHISAEYVDLPIAGYQATPYQLPEDFVVDDLQCPTCGSTCALTADGLVSVPPRSNTLVSENTPLTNSRDMTTTYVPQHDTTTIPSPAVTASLSQAEPPIITPGEELRETTRSIIEGPYPAPLQTSGTLESSTSSPHLPADPTPPYQTHSYYSEEDDENPRCTIQ